MGGCRKKLFRTDRKRQRHSFGSDGLSEAGFTRHTVYMKIILPAMIEIFSSKLYNYLKKGIIPLSTILSQEGFVWQRKKAGFH